MTPFGRLLAVAIVLALGAGCAKSPSRTAPAAPPAVRLLAARSLATGARLPAAPESKPVSILVAEPDPETGAPSPASRPEGPVHPSAAPPPPAAPPGRLGTPETADVEATTRRVNATLERARQALATVRPEGLSADARVQYQTASQLIEQADAAGKVRNFMYAIRLADKAETLARRLAGG